MTHPRRSGSPVKRRSHHRSESARVRLTVTASIAEQKSFISNSQQWFSGKLAATSHASRKVIEPEFSRAITSVLVRQIFNASKRIHQRRP
jgi:hypothetical protein